MGDRRDDPLYIILVTTVLALFCVTQVINAFAAIGPTDSLTWFKFPTEEISDRYYTSLTPVGWTFTIWGVIYIWQLVWIVFAIVIIFVKSPERKPLYTDPPTISPVLLAVYALNMALNITWLFLFDREEMVWAVVFIFLIPTTLYICIGHNCWMISKHRHQLNKSSRKYLLCNYLLLQNGLGIYAAWTTIASLLNLSITLVYVRGVEDGTACLICVCILGAIELGYFLLEVTVLEKHLRYLFTPWLVVMFALSGVMVEHWDLDDVVNSMTLGLACLAFVLFACKALLTAKRASAESNAVELHPGDDVTLTKTSASSHHDDLDAGTGEGFDNIAMNDNV